MPDFSLAGRTALVIGGSSGIGLAIAKGFGEAGARVAIAARMQAKLDAALPEVQATSPDARAYAADVAQTPAIERLAADVLRDFGAIDILVASQGTTIIKPTAEFTDDDYAFVMDTNLKSVFFSNLVIGRHMRERGRGAIVNIASLAAHRGWPLACVYAMSKHGVAGLTQTLAAEWADSGVRVNAISPGYFMTELNAAKMSPARKESALFRTPMKRFGQLDELAGAAVYLASDAAKFVTGTVLNVDGGYLASGI